MSKNCYYCFDCDEYFKEECNSPSGFNTCKKCNKMNVLTLIRDYDNSFCFEEQDSLCINIGDEKMTKKYFKIMNKLMKVFQNINNVNNLEGEDGLE